MEKVIGTFAVEHIARNFALTYGYEIKEENREYIVYKKIKEVAK